MATKDQEKAEERTEDVQISEHSQSSKLKKMRYQAPTQIDGALVDLDKAIQLKLEQRKKLISIDTDPFALLGKGGPLLRQVFDGVEFPINNMEELLEKTGGRNRLLYVTHPREGELAYAIGDIIDVFQRNKDLMEGLFPIKDTLSFAKKLAIKERNLKKNKRGWSLLREIRAEQIKQIERPSICKHQEIQARVKLTLLLAETMNKKSELPTGLFMMESLQNNKVEQLLPSEWIDIWGVIISIWRSRYVAEANAQAAAAKTAAAAAKNAADQAEQAAKDTASAVTEAQESTAVAQAQAKATEACNNATQATNAAALAQSAANNVPDSDEAQTAAIEANAVAAQAQADCTRAQAAAQYAENFASIAIIQVYGHVTEEDPCCDDDLDGAEVTIQNSDFAEIPSITVYTDGNGNYSATGRFGHSPIIGPAHILVTCSKSEVSETKSVVVTSNVSHKVDFSFDIPGWE